MENKVITLRSCYGKMKEYHFQPCKQKNGTNLPFVKKVRYDAAGLPEMILSQDELNDPMRDTFIAEDLDIVVTDGTSFDLSDPLQKNMWLAIKDSDLIVPTRDARDENGNLLIDGDKKRYGIAELYVDIPGEESERSVNRKKKITQAWTFIGDDSVRGRLTKCKLLGKEMSYAPESDVTDFLYQRAEKNPDEIIELYTSGDMSLRLLLIDAKQKGKILKKNGMYMYGESILGATDDAVMLYFKTPANIKILEAIKYETYPEYNVKPVEEPITETETPKPIRSAKK